MHNNNIDNQHRAQALTVEPLARPVDFALAVPGSKSIANRALLLAGIAHGWSRLSQVPDSDDIGAALAALSGLGVAARRSGDCLEIEGRGLDFPNASATLSIGSSGTVGRFLPGLLAASRGNWRLLASEQLSRRPLAPLLESLAQLGAHITAEKPGLSFPLRIEAQGLAGGAAAVSARRSSQFASGVLMAAPLAESRVSVTVTDLDPEETYVDLTLDLLRRFGIAFDRSQSGRTLVITMDAPQRCQPVAMEIEADFNSALYFLCLPLLVGGKAAIVNLSRFSRQPGLKFLEVITRLGGHAEATDTQVAVAADGRTLRGGFVLDMRAMAEMALTLGVLAVFADAPITMTNLGHIRGHETDRLAALAGLLDQVGVDSETGPDWIKIIPADRQSLKPAVIDSCDDHRIVMSFFLLGLAANGLTMTNPRAVNKTFPGFFTLMQQAGAAFSFTS